MAQNNEFNNIKQDICNKLQKTFGKKHVEFNAKYENHNIDVYVSINSMKIDIKNINEPKKYEVRQKKIFFKYQIGFYMCIYVDTNNYDIFLILQKIILAQNKESNLIINKCCDTICNNMKEN